MSLSPCFTCRVAVAAGVVVLITACVCYGGETVGGDNAIRAWAKAALLAQSASGGTVSGARFFTEFPVTFNLVTRKIDQNKLPFLELCQQTHGKLMLGKSVMGAPLKLGSTSYTRGLGTHSVSTIRVLLNKRGSRFTADIGVNADTKVGTVAFAVELGGKEVYRSVPAKAARRRSRSASSSTSARISSCACSTPTMTQLVTGPTGATRK